MKRNNRTKKSAGRLQAVLLTALLAVCLVFCAACGGSEQADPTDADSSGGGTQEQTQQEADAQTSASVAAEQPASEMAAALIKELTAAEDAGQGYEWSLMAIARSPLTGDSAAQELFTAYQEDLRVQARRTGGVLDEDKPTDNAKAAIALHMTGFDPTDAEGIDLLERLEDVETLQAQGINAEIWALTASAVCGRPLDAAEQYIEEICSMQLEDGSITYDGVTADVDITAMAVQALALSDPGGKVSGSAARDARDWLATRQGEDGSYGNCESTAQVILALSCLGENPGESRDFTKNGHSLYDGLIQYRRGNGFCHLDEDQADPMATEQGLCALDAIRLSADREPFFR